MVLWETSPPSSLSADLPNEVSIHCPSNSPLDLLPCHAATSMNLDSLVFCILSINLVFIFPGGQCFVLAMPLRLVGSWLVPPPGIKPQLPAVEARSSNHWSTGKLPVLAWFKEKIWILSMDPLFLTPTDTFKQHSGLIVEMDIFSIRLN